MLPKSTESLPRLSPSVPHKMPPTRSAPICTLSKKRSRREQVLFRDADVEQARLSDDAEEQQVVDVDEVPERGDNHRKTRGGPHVRAQTTRSALERLEILDEVRLVVVAEASRVAVGGARAGRVVQALEERGRAAIVHVGCAVGDAEEHRNLERRVRADRIDLVDVLIALERSDAVAVATGATARPRKIT